MIPALYSLAVTLAAPHVTPADTFTIEEIAPSIHVARKADPLACPVEGNVTIIVNDADIVVVDAGRTGSNPGVHVGLIVIPEAGIAAAVVANTWASDRGTQNGHAAGGGVNLCLGSGPSGRRSTAHTRYS